MVYDKITKNIIGAAIEIHRTLGPGLLESAYQDCLLYELKAMGYSVKNSWKIYRSAHCTNLNFHTKLLQNGIKRFINTI